MNREMWRDWCLATKFKLKYPKMIHVSTTEGIEGGVKFKTRRWSKGLKRVKVGFTRVLTDAERQAKLARTSSSKRRLARGKAAADQG